MTAIKIVEGEGIRMLNLKEEADLCYFRLACGEFFAYKGACLPQGNWTIAGQTKV